ncbi:MAG: patatin-like phospholipase family protein [Gemmatimonadetes bacterium]|nr:patatin-like phospholipase family protein [Gemmatimonadota bacterium]
MRPQPSLHPFVVPRRCPRRKAALPPSTVSDNVSASPGRHSHDIDELTQRELGEAWSRSTDSGPFGIALSGGGIRSATFSLGLLQGLQRAGLLQCFDYLSTVSGGGYTGAFWSAWRLPVRGNATMLPAGDRIGAEHPAVRHLREFSNFLSPRLQLLSYDTGRLVVAPLAGAVPSLIVALSVIVVTLVAWSLLAWLLIGPHVTASFGVLAGTLVVTLVTFEVAWKRREASNAPKLEMTYVLASFAASGIVLWSWTMLRPEGVQFNMHGLPLHEGNRDLFAPALACAAGVLTLVLARAFASRWIDSPERERMRGALDRVLSRLLFVAAAWSVIAGLWVLGMHLPRIAGAPLANASWFGALLSTLTGVFLWARGRLQQQPNKPAGDSMLAKLKPRLPQVLAYAVVTLAVLMMVVSLAWWQAQETWTVAGMEAVRAFVIAALLVIALAAFLFHPNRLGLHEFYRSRLARAYPGAAAQHSAVSHENAARTNMNARATEEQPGDDFPITDLATNRPVHLVCCAANDLTPFEPLASLQRGADSAVLSPVAFSVGSCWRTWQNQRPPTLAGAITASGAAFNSMMGAYSKRFGPASVFLMAALNLRLGRWQRHPHAHRRRPDAERLLPGVLFLKELFGMSSATDDDVHLSDGGHFENTGMYELLRRRCRYIIAADCGADPDFAFDDVGNLVRRAREDFDIEIRIDLSPLRPGADGTARQPMVAGDIHYPDGVTGVLLLFKPTLIGSEPADVTQYRSRNAAFPAESTGDQFYDEAQWESYRRLGQFAAETAFGFVQRDPELRVADPFAARAAIDERETARAARVFARARFEWLPHPPEATARISDFADRCTAIEARVAFAHQGLYREVMKEAAELNAQLTDGVPLQLEAAEYAAALGPVRDGALFMEHTYYAWDLELTRSQPLSLGVMNVLARWAYAPLFRMWWPVMRSTLTPQFARFMETQFQLERIPPQRAGDTWTESISDADIEAPGFALQCWNVDRGAEITGSDDARNVTFTEYRLRLRYGSLPAFQIQAALVRSMRLHDGTTHWMTRDFYVPPGLWGIGIGEDFLRSLVKRAASAGTAIHVRIPVSASTDAGALKTIADESQLYRSAGFVAFEPATEDIVQVAGADARCTPDELVHSTWLRFG